MDSLQKGIIQLKSLTLRTYYKVYYVYGFSIFTTQLVFFLSFLIGS